MASNGEYGGIRSISRENVGKKQLYKYHLYSLVPSQMRFSI